ncbi:hypothetical protein K501DRAFT_266428 [Backusella circina FSU 941]|nr:hypothetical protein K501DRAFT_266428 [Backusella circina FSU 941]
MGTIESSKTIDSIGDKKKDLAMLDRIAVEQGLLKISQLYWLGRALGYSVKPPTRKRNVYVAPQNAGKLDVIRPQVINVSLALSNHIKKFILQRIMSSGEITLQNIWSGIADQDLDAILDPGASFSIILLNLHKLQPISNIFRELYHDVL